MAPSVFRVQESLHREEFNQHHNPLNIHAHFRVRMSVMDSDPSPAQLQVEPPGPGGAAGGPERSLRTRATVTGTGVRVRVTRWLRDYISAQPECQCIQSIAHGRLRFGYTHPPASNESRGCLAGASVADRPVAAV
jgi:hypothetical protein